MPPVETEYYDLLGVPVDVNDTDLKKAYRKQAMRYHPDKNPSPDAEEKFKEISKAFQVLSDPNLRTVYDKNGKSMVDKEGNEMEDAAAFFANVFGGERFRDYIGEITLMKEMGSVAATVATDEERAEMEKEGIIPPGTSAASPSNATTTPSTSADNQAAPAGGSAAHALSPSGEGTPPKRSSVSGPPSPSRNGKKDHPKKRNKLSPEQRKKLMELEEERRKALEERVKSLTAKLIERLRPLVEAKHPGDPDDPETKIFQEKVKLEAEDLKLESFGVELLHTIGTVYMMKASSFLKSKKFFGLSGFWSRMKEQGSVAKDAWGVIGSALSVRSLMQEMEKVQAKGEVGEDELRALEEDMTGKILLASWRGTRFEVVQVLREVVDHVLKDREASEKTLVNRAKGLLIIGHIFKATVPDESDEDRRELERIVAEAATGKSKHQQVRTAAKARKDGKSTPPKEATEHAENEVPQSHATDPKVTS
ncbi:X-domain of DnaJ-containing-domain-containing protein [Pisolithus marmoratus]|nr:X-domain of DnaJ-containing-domain-containing protein [Pisolithus marmoratus]